MSPTNNLALFVYFYSKWDKFYLLFQMKIVFNISYLIGMSKAKNYAPFQNINKKGLLKIAIWKGLSLVVYFFFVVVVVAIFEINKQ